jgi:hypothetical protein
MSENPSDAASASTSLSAACYRVTFTAGERLDLPEYLGSTLRGAFGRAFRTLACPARFDEPCPIPAQCPYHLIFESSPPPDSEALRTHEEIPRPFVIAPEWRLMPDQHPHPDPLPQRSGRGADSLSGRGASGGGSRRIYEPGEELSFGLTLIGRAQEFFPHFVVALREMDRLGRARQTIALTRIESRTGFSACSPGQIVYDAGENLVHGMAPPLTLADCAREPCPRGPVTIEFVTQTRLKHEGMWARIAEFQVFFRRLLGRLSSMARFHCGAPLEVDFKRIIDEAHKVRLVRNDARWVSWSRYSSRQNTKMQWEGLAGTVIYDGELTPFWPYLVFGQYIHVGHGATFGLGRYQIGVVQSACN